MRNWMLVFILSLLGLVGWIAYECAQLHAYNVAHHCQPTEHVRYYTAMVWHEESKMFIPEQRFDTLYHCDNGDIWE
jgi:hypothetical protein